MARLFSKFVGPAALALILCVRAQEQATVVETPANQTTAVETAPPAEQQPMQPTNQTTTMPANQTQTTTGGRPSALSQLEVLLLGNHTWHDQTNMLHYEQSDYQIVNHSPDAICNVTLSAPLETAPERTHVNSSYNARVANSSRVRGIDIFAPAGDSHLIPANGVLNLGYILANNENATTMSSAPPTVESAQYCDEMQHNQTTTAPEAMPTNQTEPVAMPTNQTSAEPAPAMPANQTAPVPVNTTTTGGPNTTTVVTSPEGRQQPHTNQGRKGGMGSKKLNLRHW